MKLFANEVKNLFVKIESKLKNLAVQVEKEASHANANKFINETASQFYGALLNKLDSGIKIRSIFEHVFSYCLKR